MKRSLDRLTLPADLKENSGNFETVNAEHPPTLKQKPSKTPIHRVADLFVSLFGKVTTVQLPQKWSTTYRSLSKLTKILENKQQLPGARVYNRRIYDIVVESRESNQNGEIFVPPFLKDAFDIVNSFNGAKNARILSPRFAPLLPDKTTKGFLSPSLFPFYKDETEQQIMPVPKLLENAGLNEKDRERVLEMVMEVSGARDTVDKAMKVLQHLSSMGMDEKLFDVNEKIGKAFEQLRSSFTPNQNKDMESKGFTFMEPEQMQKLHRDQTPEQKRIPANCCPEADRSKSLSIRTRLWV
ncbi:hypothetical protein NECAME_16940 [Necator americanus]|uniref:Uncharacterized protein n=1 Tax=Necator americanus TaxID=51031 RepID=W2TVI7_NECAM|nr:hypothetical protein NECAME_16940 [Necator americanus]ETN85067.1 hypothetical protein NECAME_16940 [Necator americanus]